MILNSWDDLSDDDKQEVVELSQQIVAKNDDVYVAHV
jgi:hypothetical protein